MEEEQFDLLPDPSYVRGFLRAYANYLGLDADLVLDEYDSRFGEFSADADTSRRGRRRGAAGPRRREAQLLWLAIGGVTGVALLAWLGVGGGESPEGVPTTTTPTTQSTPTTATAPQPPVEVGFRGEGSRGSYLEVRRGSEDGPTLYSGVLVPGASRTFPVAESAWVRIGAPKAIGVTIDGEPVQITGGTGTFLITRTGVERLPAG